MKHNLSLFLVPLILLCAAEPVAQGGAEPLSCADRSITASAVRTPENVQAFVQCAYEFVQEVGFEESRRAFHEDERWRNGPIYVFVDEVTTMPQRIPLRYLHDFSSLRSFFAPDAVSFQTPATL